MKHYFSGGTRVPCEDYNEKNWQIYFLNKDAFLSFTYWLRRYLK